MSGTSSAAPVCGIHDTSPTSESASDCSMPMPMPATTIGTMFWNRPTTAAARAGTTNRV